MDGHIHLCLSCDDLILAHFPLFETSSLSCGVMHSPSARVHAHIAPLRALLHDPHAHIKALNAG